MHFASVFDQNTVPLELINLITNTLRYEPTIRLTAEQCLQHPYLTQVAPKLRPVTDIPRYQQQLLQSALHAQQRQQNSSFTSSANNSQTSLASVNSGQSYASQPTPTSMTPEGARSQVWRQPRRMANSASTVSLPGTPAPSVVSQASHDLPPWSHTSHTRQPTAGSSKYADRSIFEGIAPQRDYANTGIAQAQATVFDDAYSVQLQMEEKRQAREKEFRAAQQKQQQDETSQQPPHLSPPSHKSKGWSLSSVFHQDASKQPSSPSLRHSASTRSLRNGTSESAAPTDPKKAKKLAERAAKEAERAKREAASQLARERARAVMQKKSQLANRGQDIFSTAGPNSNAVPEPAPRMLPPMRQGESSRSFLQEDPSVTGSVDSRWKSRRRHDDDDIHSVSSNETHNSRNSGNEPRYSFSSYNTMDSESLPQSAWSPQATSLSRNATASSLGSTGRSPALDQFFQHHGNQSLPPKSSSSSVDSSLLRNFQGLSAADAQRLRSPFGVTSAPMDSSYPMPSAPGPGTTFVPALHSLGSRQSSANSYSSFHSMPTLPSQQQYSNLAAPSEHQEDDPMQTDS